MEIQKYLPMDSLWWDMNALSPCSEFLLKISAQFFQPSNCYFSLDSKKAHSMHAKFSSQPRFDGIFYI